MAKKQTGKQGRKKPTFKQNLAAIDKENKKQQARQFSHIYAGLSAIMIPGGNECGVEIAKVLKEKNNITIPLYRSAIVITPQKDGTVKIDTYHDPHWMGHDKITKENLKGFHCNSWIFVGQRSGVDILRGGQS